MKSSKGFTIIELIVVVAIIAVLSGIVLVNVTSYINKGKDAAIQGNLSSIMTNATDYFSDSAQGNGDYDGFCGIATVLAAKAAADKASGGVSECTESAANDAWCACSILKDATLKTYCVDSTGYKKATATATCAARCPVAGGCVD